MYRIVARVAGAVAALGAAAYATQTWAALSDGAHQGIGISEPVRTAVIGVLLFLGLWSASSWAVEKSIDRLRAEIGKELQQVRKLITATGRTAYSGPSAEEFELLVERVNRRLMNHSFNQGYKYTGRATVLSRSQARSVADLPTQMLPVVGGNVLRLAPRGDDN
jgi:hypothetical protein